MLAVGQPTHAFDSDNIKGRVRVRRARDAEKLLLLNGRELSMSSEDLVIADDEGSVGLAGVMGGAKDSVLPSTDKVILEIADFDAISVRRTAARHEARTEAAIRFEKGVDPERGDIALSLSMKMFAEFFPGMRVTGFHDNYPNKAEPVSVDVSLDWLAGRLGKRVENADIENMLTRLGFAVTFAPDGKNMRAAVPTWRATGDISIPDDIMEEVARLHGFENFEAAPIATSFTAAINQPEIDIDRKIREYLAFRCGMQEIFSYPWVRSEYLDAIFPGYEGMLSLSTPPSPDEKYIRPSLLPGLLKAVSENARFFGEFALFESAQVFKDGDYSSPYDKRESLPCQRRNASGVVAGRSDEAAVLFRRAKGIVEWLPRYAHIEPLTFARREKPSWADATAWLNILSNDAVIGHLALLSKKTALGCGIKNSAAAVFELDIDALKPLPSRTNKFGHLPEYPRTEYDISMLFDASVKWEDVRAAVTSKKDPADLIRDVSFVSEYRGRQIPEGKKSVTLRLIIGSLTKTLTSAEIESCANAVIKRIKKAAGGELRN
jgi:phenylalanyl-tRNA synthetase beta chain